MLLDLLILILSMIGLRRYNNAKFRDVIAKQGIMYFVIAFVANFIIVVWRVSCLSIIGTDIYD